MPDLTTIFGNEIVVSPQPRHIDRQYTGIAGAHGLLSMHLGTRGCQIVITGTLAATGANYAAARVNLQAFIDSIEAYTYPGVAADTYTFMSDTFYNVLFDKFQIIPDREGKIYHYTSTGYVTCRFICYLRQLL